MEENQNENKIDVEELQKEASNTVGQVKNTITNLYGRGN